MFVKICGTTSEEDALLAVALGADALGFIFAPSPRQVTAEHVSDIIKRLPPEVPTFGVFRNETQGRIVDTVLDSGITGVQLHGHETKAMVHELRNKLRMPVIKAFAAASREIRVADTYNADVVMVDAPSPGSGQVFDWRLAEGIPDVPRLLLAGGLNPVNVADAIEAVHPWGVDVVSGVEASHGKKDPTKLREFIERAKAASPHEYQPMAQGPYDWKDE